jgi:hypothetical protein
MTSEQTETRREMQTEARAERHRVGPCLLCGTFQNVLIPGRDAGFSVYCAICAIATRTAARLEDR